MNKLIVLYDGNCNLCRTAKTRMRPLDWMGRVSWVSLQEYEEKGMEPSFKASDLRKEMHLLEPEAGHVYKGFYAVRKLCLQFPLTFLPGLLMYLPLVPLAGNPIYRAIAKSRNKWNKQKCDNGSCSIQ